MWCGPGTNDNKQIGLLMSKRSSAKYKLDRRMGENVFGRPKSPVNKREYGPGQHGQRRKSKVSDFGIQLRAKQKLKGYYGDVTEKQFRQTFQQAERMKGDASQNLIGLLERRLDMIVYRAKFAPTIWSARQMVSHGHIRVNGIKCNIASRRCDVNDVIELGNKAKEMTLVMEAQSLAERDIPDYVVPDGTSKITFTRVPKLDEVPYPVKMEPNLVVEFYSR
jgi:small subunit ribosomal protein S4